MPIPLAVIDKNENIEYANSKYSETIGYIYVTTNLADWFLRTYPDKEYRKMVVEKWYSDIEKSTREGKDIEPSVYNITCKDGKVRVLEISGTWICDELMTIFNNVAGRVQVEAELNKLNEKLELRVNERTAQLENNNKELERMVKAFTGRVIRMIELKKQIDELEKNVGPDKKTWR